MITVQNGDIFEVDLSHDVPEGCTLAFHEGRTWFVRHGIAGERVRVQVTEVSERIGRADVVAVVRADPDRMQPPCRYAGECGGCDYQHMSLARQRSVKTDVLADALRRQGGFTDLPPIVVQPIPGDTDGLRWRQRMGWHYDAEGRRGLFRYRSHEVVPIEDCLIADANAVFATDDDFAQAHRGLVPLLRERITALGRPSPGEHWWDLYGGSGALTSALVSGVGPTGRVDLVERSAVSAERGAIAGDPLVHIHRERVERWLERPTSVDGVVVDPPRKGMPASVIANIARSGPRCVISISCHPASFARDLARFADEGYRAIAIEAYDAYPMTWHMEIVAALVADDFADRIP